MYEQGHSLKCLATSLLEPSVDAFVEQDIGRVVEMRSVIGGWSFLTKEVRMGRELRTDRKHEIPGKRLREHGTCQFDF